MTLEYEIYLAWGETGKLQLNILTIQLFIPYIRTNRAPQLGTCYFPRGEVLSRKLPQACPLKKHKLQEIRYLARGGPYQP